MSGSQNDEDLFKNMDDQHESLKDEQQEEEQQSQPNVKRKGRLTKDSTRKKVRRYQDQFFQEQASQSEGQQVSEFSEQQQINHHDAKKIMNTHKLKPTENYLTKYQGKTQQEIKKMLAANRYNQYGTEQTFCPGADDPHVYFVPVKKGKEDALALAILNKASHFANQKDKLNISSVVSMKKKFSAYLFIEAKDQKQIKKALDGLYDISLRRLQKINNDQYQSLFRQRQQLNSNIKKDDYIRIKGGLYDDDLGKVFSERKNGVQVMLVPRYNIQQIMVKQKELKQKYVNNQQDKAKREEGQKIIQRYFKRYFNYHNPIDKKSRPPKKLVMPSDVDNFPQFPEIKKLKFDRHSGFVVLKFGFNQITKQLGAITPKEFQMFKKDDSLGQFAKKQLKYLASTVNIMKGDEVQVTYGDTRGISGIVIEVKQSTAVIEPKQKINQKTIEEPLQRLSKKFKQTQHVTVISGNDKGKTGTILKIQDGNAILFTQNGNEIRVNTNNLTLSKGSSHQPEQSKQKLKRYELIKIKNGVGIILECLKDNLKILNLNNSIQLISVLDYDGKQDTRKNSAKNSYNQVIKNGAIIRIKDGIHSGKRCEVKHVYKDYLFLQNNDFYQTRGFTVQKCTNCIMITPSTQFKHSKPIYGIHQQPNANPSKFKSEQKVQDQLEVGKTITIKSGLHKGYQGLILSNNNNTVSVRLTAKGKTVNVQKDQILATKRMQQIGKTPRVSGSTYAAQSPAPYNQSHHQRNMDDY